MSPGDRYRLSVLWITLQLVFVLLIDLHQAMASSTPYLSEFEYSPEFHPSKNPSCPRRWSRGVWDERRSPDEGGPVGQEPSIEIRAVLVRCPKSQKEMNEVPMNTVNAYNITAGRSQDILEFHGFDRDEPAHHTEIRNCRRKLIVTMKFNNIGKTRTQEEFVVVDHVLDPVTMRKARLLNPFVFKVRQEQVLQLYGLKFQSVVNGEAKEEVINKKSSNYTGCDDSMVNPTCGQMMFDGKPIPYSQGFCCSCDPDVNVARQPTDPRSETLSSGISEKIIPGGNERKVSGYNKIEPTLEESSKSYVQSMRNLGSFSKRERSLKSSRVQVGLGNDDGDFVVHQKPSQSEDNHEILEPQSTKDIVPEKNVNEIHFHEDYPGAVGEFPDGDVSPALRAALSEHNPSRGKIDAVRNEARYIAGDGDGLSSIKENIDSEIFGGFKESKNRNSPGQKPLGEKYVPGMRNSELTAELVELEREYEAVKKSRKKLHAKGTPSDTRVIGNNSKCRDFRKLARNRASKYFHEEVEDLPEFRMAENGVNSHGTSSKSEISDNLLDLRENNSLKLIERRGNSSGKSFPDMRSIYPLKDNNATAKSTSSASSSSPDIPQEKFNSRTVFTVTASNPSSRSSSSITTIPSNNIASISTLAPTTYPALILRQELVNDKLYHPSISGTNNVSSSGDAGDLSKSTVANSQIIRDLKLPLVSGNLEKSERSKNPKSNKSMGRFTPLKNNPASEERKKGVISEPIKLKDQYADWVIKYAKMHSNQYINSQREDPAQTYDLDLDPYSSTDTELFGWSSDSLGHIAEKVMKEFETAENAASTGHDGDEEEALERPVELAATSVQTLNNPEIAGGFESPQSPRIGSAIAHDAENMRREETPASQKSNESTSSYYHTESGTKADEMGLRKAENLSRTWQEILSSKIKSPNKIRPIDRLFKKFSEENSTADSEPLKIEDPGNHGNIKNGSEKFVRKTIEPAVIVRGSGDMVKGNFPYQDQSATVIADRRSEESQSATDQDYIFLDANGREEKLSSLKSRDVSDSRNLREYSKSEGSNSSGLNSMGSKIEESLIGDRRNTKDEFMNEKFNRLDNLVRDSLRSRRRTHRSIAYDDPFHRGNDEKQAKIDLQIEKEFAEITEALNESSDSQKNGGKLASLGQTDSSKDLMLRNFAVMLNRIPKNDVLKTSAKNEEPERNGIEKLKNFKVAGKFSRKRKNGQKRHTFTKKIPRSRMKPVKKIEAENLSSVKEQPGKSAVLRQPETYLIEKNGEILSGLKKACKVHEAVDRDGAVESQTNINEIVKQVIKNDYRPSPSWAGRQEYSERRKTVAGSKAFNERNEKPGSIFSLKSILHSLHVGKLEKKCHEGTASPLLHDDEKDSKQNLPPEESTVTSRKTTIWRVTATRTHKTDINTTLGLEEVFNNVENTPPAEGTTPASQTSLHSTSPRTTVSPIVTTNFGRKTKETRGAVLTEQSPISVDPVTKSSASEVTGSINTTQTTSVQNSGVTNQTENTDPEILETEISILTQAQTTALPTATITSSTKLTAQNVHAETTMNHDGTRRYYRSSITNGLRKFSNEFRDEKHQESSEHHATMERSPIDLESEELNELDATTWVQFLDSDYQDESEDISTEKSLEIEKARLEAENLELKKELSEAKNSNDIGQTDGHNEADEEMMPTTFMTDKTTEKEEDAGDEVTGNNQQTTDLQDATSSDQSDLNNDDGLTVYQETTTSKESDTTNDEILTVYQETTSSQDDVASNHEETTISTGSTFLETVTRTPAQSTTPSKPATTVKLDTTVSGGFLNPQRPEGFGEILGMNNSGQSKVILVKTYSVSQNPREFLDNYKFPVGVKRVLLKKLNVTAMINDPVDLGIRKSLTEEVNDVVPNEEGDTDDSEIHQRNNQGEMRKVVSDDDVNHDMEGRKLASHQESSMYKKLRMNDGDDSSSLKNRRTIYEPNIDDLKLQQFQQDTRNGMEFNQKDKRQREDKDSAVNLHLVLNRLEERRDSDASSKNEFPRDEELKVTRSSSTADTLPPDDETTHSTWDNHVNATNFQLDYAMEQPIFAQKNDDRVKHGPKLMKNGNLNEEIKYKDNEKRSESSTVKNLKENPNREVEFFYDYDSDPDAYEIKRFYRSVGVRTDPNPRRIIKHARSTRLDMAVASSYRKLKKREVEGYSKDIESTGSSALVNRSGSCWGEMAEADKMRAIIPQENNEIISDTQPECRDGKWQGKMDLLKLKKHQDILKEYLNWSPNIDTTVMRIFSIYSTIGGSPTTEKHKSTQDSSTMGIVLIEEEADEKSQGDNDHSLNQSRPSQLDDKEILDRLSKTPNDDSLMIISVMDKHKLNVTNTGEPKRSVNKKRHGVKSESLKPRKKLYGDSRLRRNINFSSREARSSSPKGRSGRRLMSAVQLSENKDNGLKDEETVPEEKEEMVEKNEVLPEYEDHLPRGDASSFDYLDSSYKKHKRDKLKSNWDQLVDKIIVNNNNNNNPAAKKRNSNDTKLDEVPYDKGKTAMEKLHFFNAEKYIEMLAKKISRLSNVDNTEQDMETEKQAKVINDSRKFTHLHDKTSEFGHAAVALVDDDKNLAYEDSAADYNEDEIPYETESRLVHNSLVGQNPFFGKLGRDFEISISGKVHINGESEDQPMSISIEGVSMDNVTSSDDRIHGTNKNETDSRVKQADHIYLDNIDLGHVIRDDIPGNMENKKEIFFGEAGAAAGSPNITEIQQKREFLVAEKPETSRALNSPQKTFYNVVVRAHPRHQKSPVHFTHDFNGANESSEDLSDDEVEERRDISEEYPENNAENLTADEPSFDFEKLELRQRKPLRRNNFGEENLGVFNYLDDQPSLDDEIDVDSAKESINDFHSRRRHARRLREERTEKESKHLSSEDPGLDESAVNSGDIKLVDLIPVELLDGNEEQPLIETEQQSSVERKPVDLITSDLPKMDFDLGTIIAPKRTKIKPVRHVFNDVHVNSMDSPAWNKNTDTQVRFDDESSNIRQSKPRRKINGHLNYFLEKASTDSDPELLKNALAVQKFEEIEPQKTKMCPKTSLKYVSRIGEPCYGSKQVTTVLDEPRNVTGKTLNGSSAFVTAIPANYETKKEHLSTDDLCPPIPQPSGKIGDEILLKGVEISPPDEDSHVSKDEDHDLAATACGGGERGVCEDSEGRRKTIELKNLMTMMNFVKKLEDILPESYDEGETLDEIPDPETVVQVQSVLLLPQESSEIELNGNDEIKQLQTTSERVVEIGEGVRHDKEQYRRTNDRRKNPDIIVLEKPAHIDKSFSPEISGDKNKSSVLPDQSTSESAISRSEPDLEVPENYEVVDNVLKNFAKVQNEKKVENGAGVEGLFRTVQDKMKHHLLELEKKPSFGTGSSAEISPAIPVVDEILNKAKNDQLEVSKVNNHYSLKDLHNRNNVERKDNMMLDDVSSPTLKDRLKEKTDRLSLKKMKDDESEGLEFKERDEPSETDVRSVKFNKAPSKPKTDRLLEPDKIANILDKEGLADLKRKEHRVVAIPRRDRQLSRRARTPVTYAVGVSEMGAARFKSGGNKLSSFENGLRKVPKEKRRTQHSAKSKIVKKRRNKKKKKHRKKKKKDKKSKKKKKKWWPFKRNLLAVFQDQESKDDLNQDLSIDSILKQRTEKSKLKRRKKRQIKPGGAQVRGGQDCMDRRHPPHVNSAKYQESAHCLRFSDLWYSVYELEAPIMEHTVYLQLFEKHTLPDGTTHWDDLTQGSMVRLGTFVRHQRDSAPTIAFTYNGAKMAPQKQARNLDPAKDRLLVPSPVAAQKLSKYPEVKGGSGEYLVVQSNAINRDGNECDKAGVGFSTFATQPNRCGHPKGTCLKNQPLAYWRHDVEAREMGKPGCYFLSNFASVPNNPIKYNVSGTGSREYLGLEYHSPHVSAIDIELRADYNAIVRVGSSGRVTEVYVDSTAPEHTVVTIVVSNMGLASSPYQSRISDCPTGLPIAWSKAKGAMQVIAPQHDQRITLDLYGQLYVDDFHCSVEVVNHRGELVAMRRIRVQKMDRCFCVWHCLCACIGSVSGLGCQPMSPEHYHAAGFQGPVPVFSMESSVMANAVKDLMMFSALLVLVLLALGMVKWLIGIFIPVVSRWGLDVLLEGTQMNGYFEPELRCRSIVTDMEGNVLHPDTGKKSVRICGRRSEFFLNLLFFLIHPIAVCCKCARSSFAGRKRNCCQDESKTCLLREEKTSSSCAKLICVNTYGDTRNSKMEAEDTRYVMNELKRSRDSLQDGKGKRCRAVLRNRK